jgi:hypothetical protein
VGRRPGAGVSRRTTGPWQAGCRTHTRLGPVPRDGADHDDIAASQWPQRLNGDKRSTVPRQRLEALPSRRSSKQTRGNPAGCSSRNESARDALHETGDMKLQDLALLYPDGAIAGLAATGGGRRAPRNPRLDPRNEGKPWLLDTGRKSTSPDGGVSRGLPRFAARSTVRLKTAIGSRALDASTSVVGQMRPLRSERRMWCPLG